MFRIPIILGANHGQNLSGFGINAHQSGIGATMGLYIIFHTTHYLFLSNLLFLIIKSSNHLEAPLFHLLFPVFFTQ